MRNEYLRRYTDIPALIYLLSERKITLLDPSSWDDSNDSYFLSKYKQRKKLNSVLVLCFTQKVERYHHWRVFAGSSSGVCIRFKREDLLRSLRRSRKGIIAAAVEYLTLDDIREKPPEIDHLPFVKRHAFIDECEFRVIYGSRTDRATNLDIPVPLSCISKITLSPWMPEDLEKPMRRMLKSIEGCGSLSINRSTLVSNEEWKRIGRSSSGSAH